jgi:GNAT superfamily N-acetyltransferase
MGSGEDSGRRSYNSRPLYAKPGAAGGCRRGGKGGGQFFGMDTGWSDIQKTFATTILRNVRAGFAKDPPDCMVVRHGSRIIGVSVLDTRGDAPNHLTTGPCVLQEYRGRGLGSALLRASLAGLREASRRSGVPPRVALPLHKVRGTGRAVAAGF